MIDLIFDDLIFNDNDINDNDDDNYILLKIVILDI